MKVIQNQPMLNKTKINIQYSDIKEINQNNLDENKTSVNNFRNNNINCTTSHKNDRRANSSFEMNHKE